MKGCAKFAIAVVLVVMLLATAVPALADNPNPRVIPPNALAYGKTYGEWSAVWWQWVMAQPYDTNPFFDLTGDLCDAGQTGQVWFLAGTFGGPGGPIVRKCTIPAGTALFFPVGNYGAWNDEYSDPPWTEEFVLNLAKEGMNTATNLSADIDGMPVDLRVQYDPVVSPYRAQSPIFSIWFPADNIIPYVFGVPYPEGTRGPAASDGVWLMLAPLSAGEHRVHFSATFGSGPPIDVTYELTVAGG